MARLHLVISTHTTLHLRRTLLGAASQAEGPDTVTVSCDTDSKEIRDVIEAGAAEFGMKIRVVERPFQGASRSGQVRNNGVRCVIESGGTDTDSVLFLDGDCCPAHGSFAAHRRLGRTGGVVIGFRIDLNPEQTEQFDESALARGATPVEITEQQQRSLDARDRRYRRHAFFRRLGLVKPHKPKLLSANFSVPLGAYRAVNGFDERYIGYGQEDDDLGRRLYRAGVRPVIGVAEAIVFHSYHPTRAPGAWLDSPNAARFAEPCPVRAVQGMDNPLGQPAPTTHVFGAETGGHAGSLLRGGPTRAGAAPDLA
jgi:hypothetical protein